MNELALFAGAGGGVLAAELLGDSTVCAVERDAYAASVLAQRQNDGALPVFPIWSDVCSFDGRPWRGIVDSVAGGFPCQDISAAGSGAGLDGERSGLWREFARIVREVEPAIVRVENSPMLAARGLVRVLGDLASMGFDAEWDVVSAADLGAWHQRDRIWIIAAHPDRLRELQRQGGKCYLWRRAGNGPEEVADFASQRREQGRAQPGQGLGFSESARSRGTASDAGCAGSQIPKPQPIGANRQQSRRPLTQFNRWPAEPGLVRMVHGVPHRVDRIKCLGNAQVPRVAAAAYAVLAEQF